MKQKQVGLKLIGNNEDKKERKYYISGRPDSVQCCDKEKYLRPFTSALSTGRAQINWRYLAGLWYVCTVLGLTHVHLG